MCPRFLEDQKIVIDLSDWEDGDTDDAGKHVQSLLTFSHLTRTTADERMETSEETDVPLRMPRELGS